MTYMKNAEESKFQCKYGERKRERERDVVHVGSVHLFIYYVVYSGKFSNASLIEILCI
jgi:hypothetical protein